MRYRLLFAVLFSFLPLLAAAQKRFFSEIEVRVDTTLYDGQDNAVIVNGRPVVTFPVPRPDQVVDLFFYPPETGPFPDAELLPSRDYAIIDSLTLVDSTFFRARIQFADLSKAGIIPINLNLYQDKVPDRLLNFELFPYLPTAVTLQTKDDEAFLGEEKVFVLAAQNPSNIRVDGSWKSMNGVEYRLYFAGTQLRLNVATSEPGLKELQIPVQTYRPVLINGRLTTDLTPISIRFVARASRTAFLSLDKKDVTLDFDAPQGIEVQIDRNRLLQMRKTYRIETTAEPGGAFVGELYTRSSLANDKVLAWIRPFALHRASDGYLYIKDGDDLRFITNVNISEKTRIAKVSVRHQGGDFVENLNVSPGERIDVRIEGVGLENTPFLFDGGTEIVRDSALATANVSVYSLRIPINIARRKVVIYRGKDPTGYELAVREFQTPRELDFVTLNWGGGEQEVLRLTKPVLYDKTIQELTLTPKRDRVDAGGKLYGKQYLSVDINIYNARKELIETRRIDNFVICPGDNSPRSAFYDGGDCNNVPINLNQFLGRKTYDLPDWSTVEVIIRHNPLRHPTGGYSQKVELIVQKHVTFDVDVSFPAGLFVIDVGRQSKAITSFSGVSIAVVPQLSFYKPDRINKLRPYRIGMGFIAFNAFNFSSNADESTRDLGLVLLGSVFPTKTGSRFSFPLYAGAGYKFKSTKFFFLIGPGVQVSF